MSSESLMRLELEIEAIECRDGISSLDLLGLPGGVRGLLQVILRQGRTSVRELSQAWSAPEETVQALLMRLAEKGYLVTAEEGEAVYRVNLSHRRRAHASLED